MMKIGGLGGLIKDQDLWEVFHCCRFSNTYLNESHLSIPLTRFWIIVFRGILAMAYPGIYAGGKDPAHEWVPQQYETIVLQDGQPRVVDRGIVHFDLDIQNSKSTLPS